MSETETRNCILMAETWASSLWEIANTRWPERVGQDKNYRKYVVHPYLEKLMRRWFHCGIRIMDLGCGDCALLEDSRFADRIRMGGSYLGIDISSELIEKAGARHQGKEISFLRGNLADHSLAEQIGKVGRDWNAVISVFVIQEVPDLNTFLRNLSGLVSPGSLIIIVSVHPSFGEWLLDEGRMWTEDNLRIDFESKELWRWAGYYPIVDEPHEPFYLPYFHRTIEDYTEAFARAGLKISEIRGIPDPKLDIPALKESRISPFFQFEKNLYWPKIVDEPSALIITAEKEGIRGKEC
jgi:SAM-dependent methyltransferase